ncbi:hypothetical protein MAN_08618, partial [Metarhizium hybridum]
MGGSQPFMYNAAWRNDARFPATTFDPKAVTRASWEPKPRKPPPTGPLISFDRHPDAHMIVSHRNNPYLPLGQRMKKWIKGLRNVQFLIRVLEINAAIGSLVLLILITNIDEATGWIMRISPGVAIAQCSYAIYHLSRNASGRTPGSSAAYHVFAATSDLVFISLYAFGAFSTHKNAQTWATRLSDQEIMKYFVPAVYYMTIGAGGLHFISLLISLWLGMMFRRISLMPPDMNPLEDHLTARPFHKRSKSSITTGSSLEGGNRLSTTISLPDGAASESCGNQRPAAVPFLHTRAGSSYSISSRGSQADLPNRMYQLAPSNHPRNSPYSSSEKQCSAPRPSQLGRYSSIPAPDAQSLRMGSASSNQNKGRRGKSTESWMPTDFFIPRTDQRNCSVTIVPTSGRTVRDGKSYAALVPAFHEADSAESDHDDKNDVTYNSPEPLVSPETHPNPLASHPTALHKSNNFMATRSNQDRDNYPREDFTLLSELSSNLRKVNNSQDITDREPEVGRPWKRQRDSSIQLDDGFYSKPYGQLRSSTPPIFIGSDRKLSSGVDYGLRYSGGMSGRRNVSGKVTEEGRGFR